MNFFLNSDRRRRVAVSATPGKTKHFQTFYLSSTKRVKIIDCPGLIFPGINIDLSLQVLSGAFPVAQLREPYSTIEFIGQRIALWDRFKLKTPDEDCNPEDYAWSSHDICESYAKKKGYLTKTSRPDIYRAANEILRVALR